LPLLTILLGIGNLAMPVTSLTNLPLSPNGYHESTEPGHREGGGGGGLVSLHCKASLSYNRVR
jgi:hypothetical protein